MQNFSNATGSPYTRRLAAWACLTKLLVFLLGVSGSGCASLTNPVAEGVPVCRLPPELLGPSKDCEVTIPLTLLGQKPPDDYRLAPGDVLGIWIEGVLGEAAVPPPLHVSPLVQSRDQRRLPPALGYPVPVRADGTISLPWVDPPAVQGLTLDAVEKELRRLYTVQKLILKPGKERILVSLLEPRQHHVLVVRQEASAFITPIAGNVVSSGKRGTGHLVSLPVGENDVLHALVQSGGLPGLDACNEIIVFRAGFRCEADRAALLQGLETAPPGHLLAGLSGPVVQIPMRLKRGQPCPVHPEDVILHSGDVVFVEARDQEVFFTGGLLPPGEHVLPRDRNLDVVEAVSLVQGTLINGAFSTSNLSGNLIASGIGNPSPSLLTVLRRTPRGDRIPIRVNLRRALCDARESITVQPGDVLILQEKPSEALARYFSQTFFNFSLAWEVIHQKFATGFLDIAAPERIPARISAGTLSR